MNYFFEKYLSLYLNPLDANKILAEQIDLYMSTLTYLSYRDLLDMPLPLLKALVMKKVEEGDKSSSSDSGLGAILNIFNNRR
jgi:hypothetical protein